MPLDTKSRRGGHTPGILIMYFLQHVKYCLLFTKRLHQPSEFPHIHVYYSIKHFTFLRFIPVKYY